MRQTVRGTQNNIQVGGRCLGGGLQVASPRRRSRVVTMYAVNTSERADQWGRSPRFMEAALTVSTSLLGLFLQPGDLGRHDTFKGMLSAKLHSPRSQDAG